MQGVVRLQEVPLGMQPSHPEDKFVAGINAKLHEEQQSPVVL